MDGLQAHLAATAVDQCVPGEFACRCHEFGLIDQRQALQDGAIAHQLPGLDDVVRGPQGDQFIA
jgi:hypothetical protein